MTFKRICLIFAAALAIAVSCNKSETYVEDSLLTDITVSGEGAVKTSLSGTSVLWSQEDQLVVFAQGNSAGNMFNLKSGEGTENGVFRGVRPVFSETENYFIAYPSTATYNGNSTFTFILPSEVEYTEGTFANGSNPMLSGTSSSFGNFKMKNLCGVIKLSLKGSIMVSRLELTFDKPVSGKGTAYRGGNTLSVNSGGSNTVTVNCGSGVQLNTSTATDFYVVVPAETYSEMSVKAYLPDGSFSTSTLSEEFTITRSAQTEMSTTLQDPHTSLTVWSFNITCQSNDERSSWDPNNVWSLRKSGIYAFFNTQSPDIIGTQECEYRQRVNILDNTNGVYAAYGLGAEYGKESSGNSGGISWLPSYKDYNTDASNAIFYKTDKFDVLAKGTFWLSNDPSSVGSLPFNNADLDPRNCAWIKFRIKATGESFYFFDTHLEAHYTDVAYQARQMEAEILYDQIAAINTEDLPAIVVGDFNATASEICSEEKGDTRWSNYYWARNVDGKTSKTAYPTSYNDFVTTCTGFTDIYSSGTCSGGNSNIDSIIYKNFYENGKHGLVPGSFGTDFQPYADVTYISDHWPITATLIFDYQ